MPSYEQRGKNKLWSVRFQERDPVTGESHTVRLSGGYKTKKEARAAYEDYLATAEQRAKERTLADAPGPIPFELLLAQYWQYLSDRVKPSTLYDIRKTLEKRALTHFRGRDVRKLAPADILAWQSTLGDCSGSYKRTLFSRLSAVFEFGRKYHGLSDPTIDMDRPRNLDGKAEMLFWTPKEFSKFIQEVDDEEFEMLFRVLYVVGCRRGEALALTWSDIDLKAGAVRISKSISFKGNGETSYTVTTTKTKESRTAAIPSFLCEELKAYKKTRADAKFLFGGANPLKPSSIRRAMDAATELAKVKRIRVHDLRHSCASFLIHSGASIVAVSHQLGHKDVEQTLNTYAHLLPDDREVIRAALEELKI